MLGPFSLAGSALPRPLLLCSNGLLCDQSSLLCGNSPARTEVTWLACIEARWPSASDIGARVGLGDRPQFAVRHTGKGEKIVTLVSQCDAHLADMLFVQVLASQQLGPLQDSRLQLFFCHGCSPLG